MIYDLELFKIGKVYENGTPAVIDFNLTVEKGEFIAFLGPSGCGKTTTLRMIAGFESITSGDLMIKGERMNDVGPARRPTSMIFQNYALFPHMTVRDNVGYGLDVKNMPKAERNAKIDRLLDKLGLDDVAEKKCDKLSGGQRQRIALARGLVVEPDILLLDEPLGALDANLRKTIQTELKILQRELGVTFVFVTHAQSEALALSDRIVVMSQGRIEQISPPHELYTRPRTPFVANFIGSNTVFRGAIKGNRDGHLVVDTPFGLLSGGANGKAAAGEDASVVIPAESIELHALSDGGRDQIAAASGGNIIDAKVSRFQVVGHVAHVEVDLPDGRTLSLEAHVDKYPPGAFPLEAPIALTWKPENATVIPAH
jgi:ABC-type Fe3+/spermidine/putrescine transport system ATPase subunit